MTENDPSAAGEPLSERLRREGERSLSEHRVWQDIVTGEKIEEAKREARAVVLDALQRAPLRRWFPETRWIQVAVVARNGNVLGSPTYGEWPPNESTGHYRPNAITVASTGRRGRRAGRRSGPVPTPSGQ